MLCYNYATNVSLLTINLFSFVPSSHQRIESKPALKQHSSVKDKNDTVLNGILAAGHISEMRMRNRTI